MLTSERTTKAGTIERNIDVSIWNNVVHATITEFRQLKTKTTSTTTTYLLRRIPSQLGGIGVEVEKLDDSGECYHVLLHGFNGQECSCPWSSFNPNSPRLCRHVEACLEALKMGIL